MSDVTLNDISSGYSLSKINDNFQKIEDALNNDRLQIGGGGNTMNQDLDMNSYDLLNIRSVNTSNLYLNGALLVPSGTLTVPAGSIGAAQTDGSIALYTTLASSSGSSLLGYKLPTATSVLRTEQDKHSERVSVKDFGAVGDGVTDDTTAVQAALDYCQLNGRTLYIPAGVYLVDTITYYRPTGSRKGIDIVGEGYNDVSDTTVLQKKTADGAVLFSVGDTSGYTGVFHVSGIKFSGIAGNTDAAMQIIAGDRVVFTNCMFTKANYGIKELGGVSNRYVNCVIKTNVTGIYLRAAPAPSTSVASNNNTLDGCILTDNSDTAVNFAQGSLLNILNCDIEGNATTGGVGSSAIYVEADTVGSPSVNVIGTWFESNGNAGVSTSVVYLKQGKANFTNCKFIANPNSTYDFYVTGGTYSLLNTSFITSKTNNIFETAGVGSGNTIINCDVPNLTVDYSKTSVISGTVHNLRNGEVPTVDSVTNPLMQMGTSAPVSGGVITVTFPRAFASGHTPKVVATVVGSTTTIVQGVQVSGITNTGFTATVTFHNGTSISTTNASFHWIALGQG